MFKWVLHPDELFRLNETGRLIFSRNYLLTFLLILTPVTVISHKKTNTYLIFAATTTTTVDMAQLTTTQNNTAFLKKHIL